MTSWTLIKRTLSFHWRSHLGVMLGAAIGSAALVGALIVGDSVRESLRQRALERVGWVAAAMDLGDRLVPREHFDQPFIVGTLPLTAIPRPGGFAPATNRLAATSQKHAVSVLKTSGTATAGDGTARANRVQVYGIPWRSFLLTHPSPYADLQPGSVVLNEPLALHLNCKVGDEILLRVDKPSALSRDVVVSPQAEVNATLRLKVHAIVGPEALGNFSLQQNQLPPFNAFITRPELSRAIGEATDKANLFLVGSLELDESSRLANWCRQDPTVGTILLPALNALGLARPRSYPLAGMETTQGANQMIAPSMVLDAAGLSFTSSVVRGFGEVRSSRIFLDPPVAAAATNEPPQREIKVVPVLTYLVNALRNGTNLTPYSMVTAAGPPYTPANLRDDEIVVNNWLAEDLNLQPGSEIELVWFLPDSSAQLLERTNRFRVHSIVPLDEANTNSVHSDRTLMPDFPGIATAESTHDWDAAFPLTHKIRPKDDTYWKQHRGTPKAFITLAAGQGMWSNRFGNVTAVRWLTTTEPLPDMHIKGAIISNVKPDDLGLRFQSVRDQALAAASQSQDFGGLFIGFSFFLILAALILMGLLFAFGLQQRAAEIGTLLALGFRAKQVRKIFLFEGTALAFLGSVVGVIGGVFYARAMLHGLTTVWRSATNTSTLTFHVSPLTLVVGLLSGTAVAVVAIWLVLRKQARQSARSLLAGDSGAESQLDARASIASRNAGALRTAAARLFAAPTVATICLLLAVAILAAALVRHDTSNPGSFFGAGSLALISALAFTSWMLARMLRGHAAHSLTARALSIRGAARRRMRSVATVALLGCGVFLITSIGAFRLDAEADAWKRSSGTGGFALIGESTLPIIKNLNTRDGRDALGLDEKILENVSFVPFRVREGDDASCLNLNRAQQPRLLGVNPKLLSERGAFSFAKGTGWKTLQPSGPSIDAIGDAASIQWALGKKIGDSLAYQDERGKSFDVRLAGGLANSILQGSLIIDEAEFTRRFPGVSGYRMFLIDCPSNRVQEVSAELTRALQDFGFEATPAAQRLAAFNAVQNTYLSTFQVLGGLGLLLGSFGLGVVVLRNVLERRGELALLIALGFRQARVQKLVLAEHAALLALGLTIGVVSALIAILPSLLSPRGELPIRSLALTLGGVVVFGMISTWLATRAAVKGNLLEGLRNE